MKLALKTFLSTLVFCLIFLTGHSQKAVTVVSTDTLNFPREKIYVQFDKQTYVMPDTIWFKAYVLNAATLDNTAKSKLIYTELVDDKGKVVNTKSYNTILGTTWGSILLEDEEIPAGTYTFRAYTNWMRNFAEDLIFTQKIKLISNPKQSAASIPTATKIEESRTKQATNVLQKPDIQFMPEGGKLLFNRMQKIAFKVLNNRGKGFSVSGSILDGNGTKVIDIKSNTKGMGSFYINPTENTKYVASFNINNENLSITLPAAVKNAATLQVNNAFENDSIGVRVFSDLENQQLALVARCRGIIYYSAVLPENNKTTGLLIPKNVLPSGISQIAILDTKGNVLNERSLFVNHNNSLKLLLEQNAKTYKPREKISFNLLVKDQNNQPSPAAFAAAVTDDGLVQLDTKSNILSYLLLTSDIKGHVEDPASYFIDNNKQTHDDLEALMLTQAWVKYDWSPLKKVNFSPETDYTISGTILDGANKPYVGAKVHLQNHKKYTFATTTSDAKGKFSFGNFPAIDVTSLVIEALNKNGKRGSLAVKLDKKTSPAFNKNDIKNEETTITDSLLSKLINSKNIENTYLDGIRLNTVEIRARKKVMGSKNLNGSGVADIIIDSEILNKDPKQTVIDVLRRNVKGFIMRGIDRNTLGYFYQNMYVKFIIDGIDLDFLYDPTGDLPQKHIDFVDQYLDQFFKAEDIVGIEVVTAPSKINRYVTSFGGRGGDVAFIEITTKSGNGPYTKKYPNRINLTTNPFGERRTFYSPVYTPENITDKKPDLRSTIFWQPNIVAGDDGITDFSFYAADRKGTYTLIIEGTDMLGNFGYKVVKLKIE